MSTAAATFKRTPKRLRLGAAIAAGKVRHYAARWPVTRWEDVAAGIWSLVTVEIRRWVDANLATIPDGPDGGYSTVQLTDAGRAWLERGAP